jgi:general secretion pathway protein C
MSGSVLNFADNRQLPRLALLAAIVLLLATAAWHVQRRMSSPSIETAAPSAEPADAAPASPPADVSLLSQWQPYGAAPATESGPAAPAVVAPTPLNIQLRGVVAAKNGKAGEAIIADETGIERSYSIGEKVADGATLHAVNARDVVIKRGNQLESIALPAVPSAGGGEAPPLPEATNIPMTDVPPEPPPEPMPPEQAPEESPPPEAAPIDPAVDPAAGVDPSMAAPPLPGAPSVEALPPGDE